MWGEGHLDPSLPVSLPDLLCPARPKTQKELLKKQT